MEDLRFSPSVDVSIKNWPFSNTLDIKIKSWPKVEVELNEDLNYLIWILLVTMITFFFLSCVLCSIGIYTVFARRNFPYANLRECTPNGQSN